MAITRRSLLKMFAIGAAGAAASLLPKSAEARRRRKEKTPNQPAKTVAKPSPEKPTITSREYNGLTYWYRNGKLSHASYELKRGEMLHRHVVLRFTNRVKLPDVRKAGEEILAHTGIPKERADKLPAGTRLTVPLELIKHKIKLRDKPDEDDEAVKKEKQKPKAQIPSDSPSAKPKQVWIILDAGHGGGDPGASGNGLKEHEITHNLQARVTTLLTEKGFNVQALTTPKHVIFPGRKVALKPNAKANLNNRIAAANEHYNALLKRGVNTEHIAIVSIHADSAHPDHEGVMVMTPSARYTRKKGTKVNPHRSQALSDQLAELVIEHSKKQGLPPVENDPVRESISRGKSNLFVPGIIGKTRIPTAILVETGNLQSKIDAAKLREKGGKRFSYAAGIAHGIEAHYK